MKRILASALVCAAFVMPRGAHAADSDFPRKHESKQWFEFELRFAPYWPNIDSQPGLTGNPYHTIFGNTARLLVSAELDVQLLRIPHFGSIGPGLSFGYTQMSAPAPLADGSGVSAENTNIEVYPFYLTAVLRIDGLLRDFHVPIVPYVKLGPAYTLWRVFTDSGTSSYTNPVTGKTTTGFGGTWGEQLALGAQLNLDWIDRRGSGALDEATGINHTYIFGEWMFVNLDNFGSSSALRVGTNTFCGGLAFEF